MGIAIVALVLWFVLGAVVLMRPDDPTPVDYGLTWAALIIVLIKNVLDKM
jgi:hypothetical protein